MTLGEFRAALEREAAKSSLGDATPVMLSLGGGARLSEIADVEWDDDPEPGIYIEESDE